MPVSDDIIPLPQLGLSPVSPQQRNGETRIAEDFGADIYVVEANGSIIARDKRNPEKTAFLNSTLNAFVAFQKCYLKYAQDVVGLGEDRGQLLTKKTIEEMERLDPKAMENPANWWAMVAEQMETGQL